MYRYIYILCSICIMAALIVEGKICQIEIDELILKRYLGSMNLNSNDQIRSVTNIHETDNGKFEEVIKQVLKALQSSIVNMKFEDIKNVTK